MDWRSPLEEVKQLLLVRHPEVAKATIEHLLAVADQIRDSPDLLASPSGRSTDAACIFLAHEFLRGDPEVQIPEIMRTCFCGRFGGRWNGVGSDAGPFVVRTRIRARARDHGELRLRALAPGYAKCYA
jgi:nitric oxide reductase NorQ protein